MAKITQDLDNRERLIQEVTPVQQRVSETTSKGLEDAKDLQRLLDLSPSVAGLVNDFFSLKTQKLKGDIKKRDKKEEEAARLTGLNVPIENIGDPDVLKIVSANYGLKNVYDQINEEVNNNTFNQMEEGEFNDHLNNKLNEYISVMNIGDDERLLLTTQLKAGELNSVVKENWATKKSNFLVQETKQNTQSFLADEITSITDNPNIKEADKVAQLNNLFKTATTKINSLYGTEYTHAEINPQILSTTIALAQNKDMGAAYAASQQSLAEDGNANISLYDGDISGWESVLSKSKSFRNSKQVRSKEWFMAKDKADKDVETGVIATQEELDNVMYNQLGLNRNEEADNNKAAKMQISFNKFKDDEAQLTDIITSLRTGQNTNLYNNATPKQQQDATDKLWVDSAGGKDNYNPDPSTWTTGHLDAMLDIEQRTRKLPGDFKNTVKNVNVNSPSFSQQVAVFELMKLKKYSDGKIEELYGSTDAVSIIKNSLAMKISGIDDTELKDIINKTTPEDRKTAKNKLDDNQAADFDSLSVRINDELTTFLGLVGDEVNPESTQEMTKMAQSRILSIMAYNPNAIYEDVRDTTLSDFQNNAYMMIPAKGMDKELNFLRKHHKVTSDNEEIFKNNVEKLQDFYDEHLDLDVNISTGNETAFSQDGNFILTDPEGNQISLPPELQNLGLTNVVSIDELISNDFFQKINDVEKESKKVWRENVQAGFDKFNEAFWTDLSVERFDKIAEFPSTFASEYVKTFGVIKAASIDPVLEIYSKIGDTALNAVENLTQKKDNIVNNIDNIRKTIDVLEPSSKNKILKTLSTLTNTKSKEKQEDAVRIIDGVLNVIKEKAGAINQAFNLFGQRDMFKEKFESMDHLLTDSSTEIPVIDIDNLDDIKQ